MITTPWNVDPVKILTRRELAGVLADLARGSPHSTGTRMNRAILRLACCCGLRVSEIAALQLGNVHVTAGRPHLRVGPEGAKGKKARVVPLWWDAAPQLLLVVRPSVLRRSEVVVSSSHRCR